MLIRSSLSYSLVVPLPQFGIFFGKINSTHGHLLMPTDCIAISPISSNPSMSHDSYRMIRWVSDTNRLLESEIATNRKLINPSMICELVNRLIPLDLLNLVLALFLQFFFCGEKDSHYYYGS